ncbi:MAG: PIN domain-containing protein [Candidatus Bathyarchaeia archaeon]|jgi:predicted nucleic acid-binding protein
MTKHVIDAYAWIEYLDGSIKGKKVAQILEENDEIYTCAITIGEVVSKVARMGKDAKTAYDILLSNSQIITADEELSLQAGLAHCEMRKTQKDFGLADAYIIAAAKKLKSKILTGDPHFQGTKEAIMI